MTLMSSIKVGDIVSVEQVYQPEPEVLVGKIYSLPEKGGTYAGVQLAFDKYKQVKLSDCWRASPTQRKEYFKAMLGG